MKRSWLILLVLFLFVVGGISWAACPQDPNDLGNCDTMYVEPWPADTLLSGGAPFFVRVPIYATTDVADASIDSIIAFVFPLCYTHSNPSKYCSLTYVQNTCHLLPSPVDSLERSIFRHLERSPGDTLFNRMMRLSQTNPGEEWDSRILNLDKTSHFWLAIVATGTADRAWWQGSRVLVATMTFKLQDTMQICIDTCFWPPSSNLTWVRKDVIKKVPRMGSPHDPASYKVCFKLRYGYDVTITSINDVGNDQGKQVRINWTSFHGSLPLANHFTIFRRIDSLLYDQYIDTPAWFSPEDYPPGRWEMVGTYPAYDETVYSATVPTLKDSTVSEGMYWSVFFVRAGTDNPAVYYDSPIDSGYSLDNLSPSAPKGLFSSHEMDRTRLQWHAIPDVDFNYYTIYRDTVSGFMPQFEKRLGFAIDSSFFDTTAQLGRIYYYLVSATDFSGNESSPSNESTGIRYIVGDANTDEVIDVGDVVYLINYLFKGGPDPNPLQAGDATCDGNVDVGDVVYLINYLFKSGPPPSC